MSGFDPDDINRHFRKPATNEERLLDRAEQNINFQMSHSEKLSQTALNTERTANWAHGIANQLNHVRSLLWIVIALLGAIAWKLFAG